MRRVWCGLLGLAISWTGAAYAQSAQQTVPLAPLKAEARLVVVDVTVLDKKGVPVAGLKEGDFELKEDKKVQKLISFEEHSGPASGGSQVAVAVNGALNDKEAQAAAAQVVSNRPPVGANAWNVLLIDAFNTPAEDRGRLLDQMKRFARQMPADEPVALVVMGGQIAVVSGFQSGAAGAARYLQTKGLGPVDGSTPANIQERQSIYDNVTNDRSALDNRANVDVRRQAQRAQATLDRFGDLARWLRAYPGRKNVYWLSAGFPLVGSPFGVLGYDQLHQLGPGVPGGQGAQPLPMQQQTDKLLESARVSIYPVDARGVASTDIAGETSADTAGNFRQLGSGGDQSINVKKDDDLKMAEQQEMLQIAQATGGVARFSNDIAGSLKADFAQGESFYTLSYRPPDKEWSGAYHRIKVTLEGKGYQVSYRRGYYARDVLADAPPTGGDFRDALRLGALPASAVVFTAKLTRTADAATLTYAVDPATVEFAADGTGKLAADLNCAILEYDAKGNVLEKGLIRFARSTTPEQRGHLTAKGLSAEQTIALKPGAAVLTVGVRDRVTGKFGTVEVRLSGS